MASALYLDTSAVLRAVLEKGTTPTIEEKIGTASTLLTSRLALVEAGRAFLRLRAEGQVSEEGLADAERELTELWARCEIWEMTPEVCEMACTVVPRQPLRTLDALHLATYLLARRNLAGLELLTSDERLLEAVRRV